MRTRRARKWISGFATNMSTKSILSLCAPQMWCPFLFRANSLRRCVCSPPANGVGVSGFAALMQQLPAPGTETHVCVRVRRAEVSQVPGPAAAQLPAHSLRRQKRQPSKKKRQRNVPQHARQLAQHGVVRRGHHRNRPFQPQSLRQRKCQPRRLFLHRRHRRHLPRHPLLRLLLRRIFCRLLDKFQLPPSRQRRRLHQQPQWIFCPDLEHRQQHQRRCRLLLASVSCSRLLAQHHNRL